MKKILFTLKLLIVASAIAQVQAMGQSPTQDAKTEQEIRAIRQELIDAGKRKDRAAYERLLADGFTFIHATGGIETRQEYLDHAVGGTQLFQRADSETRDEQIHTYEGHTAVWTSHSIWRNRSDNSETILRSTNVFVKTGEHWQWAAGQSTRLPSRPKAATIDHSLYKEYVGRYEIGPGRTLTVTAERETLRGLVTGFRPAELIPKSATDFVWFNPEFNVYSEIVFIKGAGGQVIHAAFFRDGQEVWRAKKNE